MFIGSFLHFPDFIYTGRSFPDICRHAAKSCFASALQDFHNYAQKSIPNRLRR
jgi:hypothetical protein